MNINNITMSDEPQFIYLCQNPQLIWYDDNGIPNDNFIGVPHLLCKIGLTNNLRNRLDQYNSSTTGYRLPKPYWFPFAMRVNNMRAAETRIHDILTSMGRWCPQGHKELGTEWFYTTTQVVREKFEEIREEFEGIFTLATNPRQDLVILPPTQPYAIIREKNRRLKLMSRQDYMEHPLIQVRDPENTFSKEWQGWCHFLGMDTSMFPATKVDWLRTCNMKNLKTWDEYKSYNGDDMPKHPQDMYMDFTNPYTEFGIPDEIVW